MIIKTVFLVVRRNEGSDTVVAAYVTKEQAMQHRDLTKKEAKKLWRRFKRLRNKEKGPYYEHLRDKEQEYDDPLDTFVIDHHINLCVNPFDKTLYYDEQRFVNDDAARASYGVVEIPLVAHIAINTWRQHDHHQRSLRRAANR